MAKKKTTGEVNLQDLAANAGLVILRDSDYALIEDRLPTFFPNIDRIFGGGLPFGRMVEISGKPGGGKSTICFHVARVATALDCIVVLIDVEGTADRDRLAHLGIDINKVLVKQPDESKGIRLTVEEIGRTVEQTLEVFKEAYPDKHVVFIWDSVGQTPSNEEMDKDYGEKNVGARAKAITQFVTKVAPLISSSKSLLIGINQVRDDIGGNAMFKTFNTPGGKAWEHYASLRLEMKKKQAIKKGSGANMENIGHDLGVKTNKSKVSRPFQEVTAYLISDDGLPYEYNIAKMAEEAKVLDSVSNNQYNEYTDRFGNTHKKRKADFIEWLGTSEGQPVLEELFNRLVLIEFPEGYPALNNKSLDISNWLVQVWPNNGNIPTELEATPQAGMSEEDLIADIEKEIQGE